MISSTPERTRSYISSNQKSHYYEKKRLLNDRKLLQRESFSVHCMCQKTFITHKPRSRISSKQQPLLQIIYKYNRFNFVFGQRVSQHKCQVGGLAGANPSNIQQHINYITITQYYYYYIAGIHEYVFYSGSNEQGMAPVIMNHFAPLFKLLFFFLVH